MRVLRSELTKGKAIFIEIKNQHLVEVTKSEGIAKSIEGLITKLYSSKTSN